MKKRILFITQSLTPDDYLDLPPLGMDSFLTLDSNSDVFVPPLDMDNDLNVFDDGRVNNGEAGRVDTAIGAGPSPSTSESAVRQQEDTWKMEGENVGPERKTAPDEGGSGQQQQQHLKGPSQVQVPNEDEAKRQARMKRNRENAFLSRQRKKQQTIELQQQCSLLRRQTTQLTCMVQRLVAENCLLRHHLSTTCQRAGIAVPDVPSALKAAPATPTAGGHTGKPPVVSKPGEVVVPPQASGLAPMKASPGNSDIVTPQISVDNRSEGTRMPAAPPAPPAPAAAAPGIVAGGRKRARTTGASAAFLALFSIFMFVGHSGYLVPGSKFVPKHAALPHSTSSTGPLALLPAGSQIGSNLGGNEAGERGTHGRSLLAVQGVQEDPDLELEQWPLVVKGSDTSVVSKESMAVLVNQTLEALYRDPHNPTDLLAKEAMERIRQLGPAAVLLDGKVAGGPSITFPFMASHFLEGSGLANPQTCTKVFEFSAATMSNSYRSKRKIDKFVSGSSVGFKGRSLASNADTSRLEGILPLSSKSDSNNKDKQMMVQRNSGRKGNADVIDSKESGRVNNKTISLESDENLDGYRTESLETLPSEPTLVSLMLPRPSKAGLLSAIDRILIMFLYPGDRFVTYSCSLSRPLLAN